MEVSFITCNYLFDITREIIIFGYTLIPSLATFIADVNFAFACISVISTFGIPSFQPRSPNIGLLYFNLLLYF